MSIISVTDNYGDQVSVTAAPDFIEVIGYDSSGDDGEAHFEFSADRATQLAHALLEAAEGSRGKQPSAALAELRKRAGYTPPPTEPEPAGKALVDELFSSIEGALEVLTRDMVALANFGTTYDKCSPVVKILVNALLTGDAKPEK